MPAGRKRRNTETRQTRSCNVVLKNIEAVEKRYPARPNSKSVSNEAISQKTAAEKTSNKSETQYTSKQNKATAATSKTPIQSKSTQNNQVKSNSAAAVNRRKSVNHSNLVTPKLTSVEVRLSRLRRNSLPAPTHLLKKEVAARTAKGNNPAANAAKPPKESLKLSLNGNRNARSRSRSISNNTPRPSSGSAKEKMYKQTKLIASVPSTPTIAASRSRRAIKPNPKYVSEDIVTPKYVSYLANDSIISSNKKTPNAAARISERRQEEFFKKNLDDDFINEDEDDDDDITDAAFDPHTQNSDDDEEELSDFDSYSNVVTKSKAQAHAKRGRGRPKATLKNILDTPKFSNTPGRAHVTTSSSSSTVTSTQKTGVKSAPTQLQQLRRTMSMSVPRLTASNQVAGNKRKLYMEDDDDDDDLATNQTSRKRMLVTTSTGATAARAAASSNSNNNSNSTDNKKLVLRGSMPMVNGANKNAIGGGGGSGNTTSGNKIQVTRSQPNAANSTATAKLSSKPTTSYQRALAAINSKTTEKTATVSNQRISPAQTRAAKQNTTTTTGTASTTIKASPAVSATTNVKCSPDDTHTFTIVNIDNIVNQDDVLISTTAAAAAAAAAAQTARTSGGNKKSSSSGNNSSNATHYNNAASSNVTSSTTANRRTLFSNKLPVASSGSTSTTSGVKVVPTTMQLQLNSKLNSASKPAPRILNTEAGKKTQSMKPLMNMVDDMAKDIRPVMYDDDVEDFDLDDEFDLDDDLYADTNTAAATTRATTTTVANMRQQRMPPRRTIYANSTRGVGGSAAAANAASANTSKVMSAYNHKRRLTTLLGNDKPPINVRPSFKKPNAKGSKTTTTTSPIASVATKPDAKENSLAATNNNQQQQRTLLSVSKVMKTTTPPPPQPIVTSLKTSPQPKMSKPLLTLPPEVTTIRCEGGRVTRKITCYENWYVITVPKKLPHLKQNFLEIPLVRLANVVNRIKLPSSLWSSKVTLYKLSPATMTKQTNAIYTGDLKVHNIDEMDRHKYQPSCVLFRRATAHCEDLGFPYDRAIIFKNKSFYTNIDGNHVNLIGAPDIISTGKDIETFLNIVDELTLDSSLVEIITSK